MHTTNFDISIEELSKIEGAARCDIKVRDNKILECTFAIAEMRRFFTQAVRGKQIAAVPQQVARICGTCSNAHLLASVKAIENGLDLIPSEQTKILRQLLNYGLIIRDHGLHLYVFVLPDVFSRDSILDFRENDPTEHELVHDCFSIKNAGNRLAIAAGGRSVHAPYVKTGGFLKIPTKENLSALIPILTESREKIIRLIRIFYGLDWSLEVRVKFLALTDPGYTFLDGIIKTSDGTEIPETEFAGRLKKIDIPYSQATGYKFGDETHMVGALARMNLNREALHPKTKESVNFAIDRFPSRNIYDNNLAQAVEMLHAVDASIDLIRTYPETDAQALPVTPKTAVGTGLIEAPRGTLLHRYELADDGTVKKAVIIVPTGQNQIGIGEAVRQYVETHLDREKDVLEHEIEKIVRAYDPCMSCASHFLKFRWK